MISRNLKRKIKTSDAAHFRLIRAVASALRRPPVPRAAPFRCFYLVLFFLWSSLVSAWWFLHAALWAAPVLCALSEKFGRGVKVERVPYIMGSGRLRIGDRVHLSGLHSIAFGSALAEKPIIELGEGTFVGHSTAFVAGRGIRIGKHCHIASQCRISDMDGHKIAHSERECDVPLGDEDHQEVVIGDSVWLGNGVTVLKGVTIGDRAVVGARSVVTKSIPPDCIAAGNPARVIRSLTADASVSAATEAP